MSVCFTCYIGIATSEGMTGPLRHTLAAECEPIRPNEKYIDIKRDLPLGAQ